jgi:hypothetical protein
VRVEELDGGVVLSAKPGGDFACERGRGEKRKREKEGDRGRRRTEAGAVGLDLEVGSCSTEDGSDSKEVTEER